MHRVEDGEVDWFGLDRGTYARLQPDAAGILASRVFPGLWLGVPALLAGNLPALRSVLERGLAAPEHAAFCRRMT